MWEWVSEKPVQYFLWKYIQQYYNFTFTQNCGLKFVFYLKSKKYAYMGGSLCVGMDYNVNLKLSYKETRVGLT